MTLSTVIRGARRVDPVDRIDDTVDLLIADGVVDRVGPEGAADAWITDHTEVIDADGAIVCPGLVDLHTHVFGAAGVDDPDVIGVDAGVPVIVDAGGAGAATVDDLVATRVARSRTRIKFFLSAEAGGITEADPAHNTSRSAAQMQTASLDEFLAAAERHADHLVGLKAWATALAGLRWLDHAVGLSEAVELPLMVHIGDLDPEAAPEPTFTGEALDRMQGGDVVTHCFTSKPGALITAEGEILCAVTAAKERGVLFDTAPGGLNLSFARAEAALARGWLPDTISSDLHRFCLESPTMSLARVMSAFLAMGLGLHDTIERASLVPADVAGVTVGRPIPGSPATLSVLRLVDRSTIFSDGSGGAISGTRVLEPVGCLLEGAWFDARTGPADAEITAFEATPAQRAFLDRLRGELNARTKRDACWRGAELHRLVHEERAGAGINLAPGLDALYDALVGCHAGPPAGWLLEQLGPAETFRRLDEVL